MRLAPAASSKPAKNKKSSSSSSQASLCALVNEPNKAVSQPIPVQAIIVEVYETLVTEEPIVATEPSMAKEPFLAVPESAIPFKAIVEQPAPFALEIFNISSPEVD